ncbi:hypothetical protein KUTeg_016329 [Tegillarca granosa]|uniref:Fucosyltransferase n=1 Tax=Tegillarca granosa TaxID=220873 RepID=A0ABQ9EKJ6_TEGGR|nr:hypothetical protein KUTeg_016329 [Tegillarca granosa]
MTESLITLNSEITLKVENSTATPGRHFVTEIPDLNIENLDIGKQYSVEELLPDGIKIHNADDDRIMLQLNHVPKDYQEAVRYERPVKKKTIYFYGGLKRWGMPDAKTYFKEHKCKIDKCDFIDDTKEGRNADAIVFSNPGKLPWKKPWPRSFQKQIWALLMLESPFHTRRISDDYKNMFNWTMTYRRDSTISTPYQKIQIDRNRKLKQNHTMPNMAAGKTKKVAWFVSNCVQVQSGRMKYAEELSKHIDVDIFGSCGKKRCSKRNMGSCFDILNKDYKFYLSFENSKCKHYVTEKLFENALRNNIVPVVLGASPVDYQLIAPPGSFIHVEDFSSPKALADYLHKLDSNDELYNQYFEWKSYGTFIDAAPWCRFCAMLHETELPNTWYSDINDWWGAKTTCIGRGNWPKNLE